MTTEQLYDFLMKNNFQEWVLNPTSENSVFWETWLKDNAQYADEVAHLQNLIKSMELKPKEFTPTFENTLFADIKNRIEEEAATKQAAKVVRLNPVWRWVAAASVIFVVSASVLFYLNRDTTVRHQTAFGETKVINLPDGSKVTLNSNSTLTYTPNWQVGENRAVNLVGEAFFDVNEQNKVGQAKDKFTVYTEGVDVEVLGTKFNVNTYRQENTKVTLQSGSVRLTNKLKPQTILMKPGEVAALVQKADTFRVEQVNPVISSAWIERKLVFNGTTIREIAHIIEDTYGTKAIVESEELGNRKVNGEILIQDKMLLFKGLSALYNLKIVQINDKTIRIEENKPQNE